MYCFFLSRQREHETVLRWVLVVHGVRFRKKEAKALCKKKCVVTSVHNDLDHGWMDSWLTIGS